MRFLFIFIIVIYCHTLWAIDPAEELANSSLKNIFSGKLDQAKQQNKKLLSDHPTFALGKLIESDIKTLELGLNPITLPGSQKISKGSLIALRSEAQKRWSHRDLKVDHFIPNIIIQAPSPYKHIIVNDLASSRMYLFRQNNKQQIQLLNHYYIGIGKEGFFKIKEGDQKTPVGLYRIMYFIHGEELPELYGDGAFTLNYPNKWDQLMNYSGNGIWIHGVPHDSYNRAPLSSNGCITLNNQTLLQIKPHLLNSSLVFNVKNINWLTTAEHKIIKQALLSSLSKWQEDWQSLNLAPYLAHYHHDFIDDKNKKITAWNKHKRRVNRRSTFIQLELDNIEILRFPKVDDAYLITFKQHYFSNLYKGSTVKSQVWQKFEDNWKIIYEGKALNI